MGPFTRVSFNKNVVNHFMEVISGDIRRDSMGIVNGIFFSIQRVYEDWL